jgi:phosphoglycolate phosphatase-like HAD superfamily hydrolase
MFDVCLFDLDQTLLSTDDLAEIREGGKNRSDAAYIRSVEAAFRKVPERAIYTAKHLKRIKAELPDMKMGIFTRSPRSYAQTVLSLAYPDFIWDIIVAYEDVGKTKPYGDGIDKAMFSCGYKRIDRVALVGDGDVDIRSSYHAGSVMILDKSSWNSWLVRDNWKCLEHMPDAIIDKPDNLLPVLKDYKSHLPDLERRLYSTDGQSRFDKVNKFIPQEIGGGKTPYGIYSCGRSFSNYKSLEWRKRWHKLTQSIQDHKDSDRFATEWVDTVRAFISTHFMPAMTPANILVAVVPHRPGRKPRLEAFLNQLAASYGSVLPGRNSTISFAGDLLGFKETVKSNHGDFLGRTDRFINIRDNLIVRRPDIVDRRRRILVIDDVSTTGSSLIYAKKHLEDAGAFDVTCLSLAMNITDVHYD